MAKKDESKIVLERTYNVPLRRTWLYTPMYRRAKRAVNALKEFMMQHMKADRDNIRIGKYANLDIWKNGMQNPPHHIKVDAKKDDKGIVTVELVGAPKEAKKPSSKKKVVQKEISVEHDHKEIDEKVQEKSDAASKPKKQMKKA